MSSDGSTTYLTAEQSCTCPAGVKSRRCYHLVAARILLAVRAAPRAA
ncbi:hypothetical protein [Streptosporangium sp. NPDC002524]